MCNSWLVVFIHFQFGTQNTNWKVRCNINIHVQHGHVLKIKLNASISIFKIRYAYEGSFGRCKMPDEHY